MASRPGPSQPAKGQSSVRRNLFHGSLSRRPTSATSTSTSATTYIESPHDTSSEIVVRDRNGNYQISLPTLPLVEDDPPSESQKGTEERPEQYVPERNSDPAELHAEIQTILRKKVESLEYDNWMYEPEMGTNG
ncbi:hypothetical protein MMC14_000692 [Varicellaria rhodocarpa]|nr:hypothetical protein [Varicellaria rhodocarpa]